MPKKPPDRMTATITIRVPADCLDGLREIKNRVGVPVSEQIRRAIAQWIDQQAPAARRRHA